MRRAVEADDMKQGGYQLTLGGDIALIFADPCHRAPFLIFRVTGAD
jgi:hypothetical protein